MVIFAHGSGSSGPNISGNQYLASILNQSGIVTLLADLLTTEEQKIDNETRNIRFDIKLLAGRLSALTQWVIRAYEESIENIGYFRASTGAAAALVAASSSAESLHSNVIKAIVLRVGRPDLAGSSTLKKVHAATLLLVGGNDATTLKINQKALQQLKSAKEKRLVIVPGAGHLFEEPGTIQEAAWYAASWFEIYLSSKEK